MNPRSASLALLLLCASPCLADEFDLGALLENAKPAGDRWERCAAARVQSQLRSRRSAEDVAERALDGCKREEAALRAALRQDIGSERALVVTALVRSIYEASLVRVITTLRER